MGRGSARVKTKKIGIDKESLSSMKRIFVTDPKKVPVYISIEKFDTVRNNLITLHKSLSFISSEKYRKIFPSNENGLTELSIYALKIQAMLSTHPDIIGKNAVIGNEETNAETYALYEALKKDPLVQSTIVLCSEFKAAEAFFKKENDRYSNINFPLNQVGPTYNIFNKTAPSFDLKDIWNSILPEQTTIKEFYLVFFERIYEAAKNIYQCITSPDVDPKEMAQVIKSALMELRKMPELSDCGEIFDMIEKSTGMLEDNFSSYYREADAAGDSNMIISNFISDVATLNKASMHPRTAMKFKKFVSFIEKHSQKTKGPAKEEFNNILNLVNMNIDKSIAADKEADPNNEESDSESDDS